MKQHGQLVGFFNMVAPDKRLGATHISVYMVLFYFWHLHHFKNPFSISRHEVMQLAKINGRATYHKCMKELQAYGYIVYSPSFNPFQKSMVYIQLMNNN